jgi:hypothetical protein
VEICTEADRKHAYIFSVKYCLNVNNYKRGGCSNFDVMANIT